VKKFRDWEIGDPNQEKLFPRPVESFHSLSFPRGEKAKPSLEISKSSPPFEKGRTGGIFGKAFSKR
jgi:hypothetical protein